MTIVVKEHADKASLTYERQIQGRHSNHFVGLLNLWHFETSLRQIGKVEIVVHLDNVDRAKVRGRSIALLHALWAEPNVVVRVLDGLRAINGQQSKDESRNVQGGHGSEKVFQKKECENQRPF
jgi:hypothetical protein